MGVLVSMRHAGNTRLSAIGWSLPVSARCSWLLNGSKSNLRRRGCSILDHKKPLPEFPRKIGVITSETGAAVQDILRMLSKRYPLVEVVLCPTLVQGDEAAPMIARAIERMNCFSDIDLLIVGRGGGSIEDLWAFNEEIVARAIFASEIPIVSAVGHETDFTISDFVADQTRSNPVGCGRVDCSGSSRASAARL